MLRAVVDALVAVESVDSRLANGDGDCVELLAGFESGCLAVFSVGQAGAAVEVVFVLGEFGCVVEGGC